jgi:histidinol-phosphatase (PHP family)
MPLAPGEFYDRIVEAAAASGLAAEVSSAAWLERREQYRAPALLSRLHDSGVPVRTASDAHDERHVALRVTDLADVVGAVGYDLLAGFRRRRRHSVAIAPGPLPRRAPRREEEPSSTT